MTAPADQTDEVEVNLTIAASPATIFRYFTEPDRVRQWLGPRGVLVPGVAGSIRVESPMGPPALGRMVEWVENERIAFTWGHPLEAGLLPPDSTRVTITLTPVREGTRVVLRHTGLRGADRADAGSGWRSYLGAIAWHAARAEFEPRLASALDAYTRAWSEPNPAVRAGLLTESFATQGTFRDRYAVIEGRDALHAHIAGVLRFMPGLRVERPAPADQCHMMVRSAWRIVDAAGAVQGSGVDYVRLDPDGRLVEVTGFWDSAGGSGVPG